MDRRDLKQKNNTSIETRRLELDQIFRSIAPNVYYQPPVSMKMKYPAIRYERTNINSNHADNQKYKSVLTFQVTTISKEIDDPMVEKIFALPYCSFDRHYIADNLHHDVFSIRVNFV